MKSSRGGWPVVFKRRATPPVHACRCNVDGLFASIDERHQRPGRAGASAYTLGSSGRFGLPS